MHSARPRSADRRRSRGISLLEALVATSFLGIALMAFGQNSVSLTRSAKAADMTSAAHALAQHQIERLRSMPLGAAGLTPGAYADGGNPLRADGSAGGGKYNRTWTVSANDVPTWGLKTVTVRVCWAPYGNHCTSVAAYVRCSNVPCVGA